MAHTTSSMRDQSPRAYSGHHFVSNLMFGPEHQISQKTAPLGTASRTYIDFISDLMFGSKHQIQRSKCTDLINDAAVPRLADSSHRGAEGSDGLRRNA
jgi:hypothetical protein